MSLFIMLLARQNAEHDKCIKSWLEKENVFENVLRITPPVSPFPL